MILNRKPLYYYCCVVLCYWPLTNLFVHHLNINVMFSLAGNDVWKTSTFSAFLHPQSSLSSDFMVLYHAHLEKGQIIIKFFSCHVAE